MNIRNFLRLGLASLTTLFWASCGGDSSTQPANSEGPVPDSSDIAEKSSSSENQGTSSETAQGNSEQVQGSSSSEAISSAEEVSSSSEAHSSSSEDPLAQSSSSAKQYILAKDSSVTCTRDSALVSACYSSEPITSYSCMELQEFLKKDTLVSEKILNSWEEKLEFCGEVYMPVALYGIFYNPCSKGESYYIPEMACSDGRGYRNFKLDSNLVYTSTAEYNEAHGIVPEDLTQNCPQDGFALFADILADVQKELYERIAAKFEDTENPLTDVEKDYYEGILDRENKKLKGPLAPYIDREDVDVMVESLEDYSDYWFDGYIAKSETCAEGTTVLRERYQEKYKEILEESLEKIEYGLRTYRARN